MKYTATILSIAVMVLSGCRSKTETSTQKLFFDGDVRRAATQDEMLYTAYITHNGYACSASFIDDDVLITAEHCDMEVGAQIISGSAFAGGVTRAQPQYDAEVTELLGVSVGLDIEIFKVKWKQGSKPQNQKVFQKIWATKSDFPTTPATDSSGLSYNKFNETITIHTVGFPWDQDQATYTTGDMLGVKAWGQPGLSGEFDFINSTLGITQGNSGGYTSTEDFILVGIVSNESGNMGGNLGKEQKNSDDLSKINSIGSMAQAYNDPDLGATLKSLFDQNGNSINNPLGSNTDDDSSTDSDDSSTNDDPVLPKPDPNQNQNPDQNLSNSSLRASGDLEGNGNVSVFARTNGSNIELHFSANQNLNIARAAVCLSTLESCVAQANKGEFDSPFYYIDHLNNKNGKSIYKTQLSSVSGATDVTVFFGLDDMSIVDHGHFRIIRN